MARLPADVQDALDRLEPALRDAFLQAIDQITNAVRLQQLETLIRAGDIEGAVEALRLEQGFFGPLYEAQRVTYMTGGPLALSGLRIRDPYDGSKFVFSFNGRHDRAERWIREQSSRLITEVIEDQKEQARIVIREAAEIGQHPRDTARAIVGKVDPATGKRAGGILGLDRVRRGVFQKVMDGMTTHEGVRDLVTVPRDGSAPYVTLTSVNEATKQRILRAYHKGEAVPAADIAISRKQLRNKLLKDRGDTIARTEALNGLRAGRHEGMEQLVESGAVRRDQVRIRWQSTLDSRLRDTHRFLHNQTVRLGDFFNPAPGVFMQYPGDLEHSPGNPKGLAANTIQCRCLAVYRIRNDLMRYEDD